MTTHQMDEAERLCTNIGILQNGRIAAEGSLEQLCATIPARQLAMIESDKESEVCKKSIELGWEYRRYGGRFTLLLPERYALKEVVNRFDGIPLSSVSLQEVGLEHVYFEAIHES